MAFIDIPVPDLGDIADAAIIEILVKPGQTVATEQSLITLESDKASMEVPSPQAGVVGGCKVRRGDRVGQGPGILRLDVAGAAAAAATPAASPAGTAPSGGSATATVAATSTPAASSPASSGASGSPPARGTEPARAPVATPTDTDCDVLVLGGGPGGYSAAFRAADLGLKVILIERYAELGGVCLNVGCIPSKALLHVAAVMDEVKHFDALGVSFGEPKLDLAKLRAHKSGVTGKLTQGLVGMAKARKVEVVRGYGTLVDAHTVKVELTSGSAQDKTGETRQLRFKRAILAAGSQAVRLPFMPEDPRVVDSTGALALTSVPKKMLVIGGGIIGLEMGTVYSTLGARIDVVEMGDGLMPGADRDLVKVWDKVNAHRFDRVMLSTKTVAAEATPSGIKVSFASAKEGEPAPEPAVYDLVLQAVGRSPNGRKIGAEQV